ncbi:MAG: CARDB domain-containing protein, partial [Planctomycetota bacterium]
MPAGFLPTSDSLASSILPGQSDTLTVRLDTQSAGLQSGRVVIETNDPGTPSFEFTIQGEVGFASIGGLVWRDDNGNGMADTDEPGLPGVTIYIDHNNNGVLDESVVRFNATAQDLASNGSILDRSTTLTPIHVSGVVGEITGVSVLLDVTHTFLGDLSMALISPKGTRVGLVNAGDLTGEDLRATVFSDQASMSLANGAASYTGDFAPSGNLAEFLGETPVGAWLLEVTDTQTGDSGQLDALSLELTLDEPTTLTSEEPGEEGRYAFSGLEPGLVYPVRQAVPTDLVQVSPLEPVGMSHGLRLQGVLEDGSLDAGGVTVDGLDGVSAIAVDPTGAYLYASSDVNRSLTVLSVDAGTGLLHFVQQVKEGDAGGTEPVEGLGALRSIAIDPNGQRLFTVSAGGYALLNVFDIDPSTGSLTLRHKFSDSELSGANALVVSGTGENLYVASAAGKVLTLTVDPLTGEPSTVFSQIIGEVDSLALSPDGGRLYATSVQSDLIHEIVLDGSGIPMGLGQFDIGLMGVTSIAATPDGQRLLATLSGDHSLVVFEHDAQSDLLTPVQTLRQGQEDPIGNTVSGLVGPSKVALNAAGDRVYVSSQIGLGVAVFARDTRIGELTFIEHRAASGFVSGNGGSPLAVSPDGKDVWVGSTADGALGMLTHRIESPLPGTRYVDLNLGGFDRVDFADAESRVDLRGSALSFNAPSSASAGQSVPVEYEIEAFGQDAANPFDVGFYLSGNSRISAADLYLGSARFDSGLPSGGVSGPVVFDAQMPPAGHVFWDSWGGDGVYFVGMVVDLEGEVPETNESNNLNAGALTDHTFLTINSTDAPLAPDLQATGLILDQTVAGQTTLATVTIDNLGDSDAGAFDVRFFLDGELIETINVNGGLPAGGSTQLNWNIDIPSGFSGSHEVRVDVDGASAVPESDEINNTVRRVALWENGAGEAGSPDLVLSDWQADGQPVGQPVWVVGQTVAFSVRVRNIGDQDAGASVLGVRLSDLLGEHRGVELELPVPSIVAGNDELVEFSYTFGPDDLGLGVLSLIADSASQVDEGLLEGNNAVEIRPFRVVEPGAGWYAASHDSPMPIADGGVTRGNLWVEGFNGCLSDVDVWLDLQAPDV